MKVSRMLKPNLRCYKSHWKSQMCSADEFKQKKKKNLTAKRRMAGTIWKHSYVHVLSFGAKHYEKREQDQDSSTDNSTDSSSDGVINQRPKNEC